MAFTIKISDIREHGFTTVYEGEKPEVDIVLVHGLGGDARSSWTAKAAKNKSSSAQKISWKFSCKGSSKDEDSQNTENSVFWPVQFLSQDFANSRILTFGYDSTVISPPGSAVDDSSYYNYGLRLLYGLRDERSKCLDRPIIWIAHSLGGILVKEVLLNSFDCIDSLDESEAPIGDIYSSTRATLFLGTPHRGSNFASWAAIGERCLLSAAPATTTIVQQLETLSPDLENTRRRFQKLWKNKRGFEAFSFQESVRPLGFNAKVVEDDSSTLDDAETKRPIPGDHRNMCKFDSENCEGYRAVKGELRGVINRINKRSRIATEDEKQRRAAISDEERNECLRSLWYKGMDSRRNRVGDAASGTCDWLPSQLSFPQYDPEEEDENELENEDVVEDENIAKGEHDAGGQTFAKFSSWMQAGGLLWIEGKAGSGKSTLMKHTIKKFEEYSSDNVVIIHFFFDARASRAEQSPVGLFRTLLHQLLRKFGGNLKISSLIVNEYKRQKSTQMEVTWELEELKVLFERLCQLPIPARIIVFLEALDEMETYEGFTASDVIRFFSTIHAKMQDGAKCSLGLCFSSRLMNSIDSWWPSNPRERSPRKAGSRKPFSQKIVMQEHNRHDIRSYVNQRLDPLKLNVHVSIGLDRIADRIIEKAKGVFIWVHLVMKQLLEVVGTATQDELANLLGDIPDELGDLYHRIMLQIDKKKKSEAIRMINTVMFAREPLSVSQMCFAFSVVHDPPFESYTEMKKATDIVLDEKRFEKRIKEYTNGLLEIVDDGSKQVVQALHQSVIDYFRSEVGIACLQPSPDNSLEQSANCFLLEACVNALCLPTSYDENQLRRFSLKYWRDRWHTPIPGNSTIEMQRLEFCFYACEYWHVHAQNSSVKTQCFALNRMLENSGRGFAILRTQRDFIQSFRHDSRYTCPRNPAIQYDSPESYYHNSLPLGHDATPLYIVVSLGLVTFAESLIDTCDTDVQTIGGHLETPLALAIAKNQQDMIKILCERGAIPIYGGGRYQNVLQAVAVMGHVDIFLRAVDICSETGQNAPHLTISLGDDDYVKILHRALLDHAGDEFIYHIMSTAPDAVLVRANGKLPIELAAAYPKSTILWTLLIWMTQIGAGKMVDSITLLQMYFEAYFTRHHQREATTSKCFGDLIIGEDFDDRFLDSDLFAGPYFTNEYIKAAADAVDLDRDQVTDEDFYNELDRFVSMKYVAGYIWGTGPIDLVGNDRIDRPLVSYLLSRYWHGKGEKPRLGKKRAACEELSPLFTRDVAIRRKHRTPTP